MMGKFMSYDKVELFCGDAFQGLRGDGNVFFSG